jgi:hypothetical protein
MLTQLEVETSSPELFAQLDELLIDTAGWTSADLADS